MTAIRVLKEPRRPEAGHPICQLGEPHACRILPTAQGAEYGGELTSSMSGAGSSWALLFARSGTTARSNRERFCWRGMPLSMLKRTSKRFSAQPQELAVFLAGPAVEVVPLGHDVRVPRAELLGVRGERRALAPPDRIAGLEDGTRRRAPRTGSQPAPQGRPSPGRPRTRPPGRRQQRRSSDEDTCIRFRVRR